MVEALTLISSWAIPFVVLVVPLVGYLRGVKVYEAFIEGAEDGFKTAVNLIPYLVAILAAIGIFRASGAWEFMLGLISPVTDRVGVPAPVLPLALMRPLSGAGSLGIVADLMTAYGPDSFIGRLASTMQGSTDTTFYILTVYFGSVGVTRPRHAVAAGLIGDLSGIIAAVFITSLVFGS